MADRSILYRLRAALQGGKVAVAPEIEVTGTHAGLLSGVGEVGTALSRIDGTGIGAAIFRFIGAYSANNTNISQWFGNKQQIRMRCTDSGLGPSITGTVPFDLPGTTALNTAFDALASLGLDERLTFIIEYTGPSKDTFVIRPRAAPDPQIGGTTSIIVRTGIAAQLEITRSSGTISNYVFQSIGQIGSGENNAVDAIKLINPTVANWDASASGTLPTSGVAKGNAYRVVNAPSDGSGRFGEVMQNDDWVVWFGEAFTSWGAEPHQWLVLPAHEVRRISALEQDFLTHVQESPESDRNAVTRGADYATDPAHGEIRMKIYATAGDYDATDLNTTGIIDQYTNASAISGRLAIRLAGTQATLQGVLPTLYVYREDGSGNFSRLANLAQDFTHQGDFGGESDYLAIENIDYAVGDTLRVYIGSIVERYNIPSLDVSESNLSDAVQSKLNRREAWASIAEVLFSGAAVKDVHIADRVVYDAGYTRGVDWRDMAQSTTITTDRYIDADLNISVSLAAFTVDGFGVFSQRLCFIELQRNDAQTGDGALVEIGPGQPLVRVNTSNLIQVNTTPGEASASWSSLSIQTGNPPIGSGANYLIFEILPRGTGGVFEFIAALYDGTNYLQLNNVNFTISGVVTGDEMGFSRSSSQRGQVLRFSAINSPGYLTHAQLESLLRQHVEDKWNFGYARLIEGGTTKEVTFQTIIDGANGLRRGGQEVPNILTGSGAPTVTPGFVGQEYIDTVGKVVYKATDITGSGDWVALNS